MALTTKTSARPILAITANYVHTTIIYVPGKIVYAYSNHGYVATIPSVLMPQVRPITHQKSQIICRKSS